MKRFAFAASAAALLLLLAPPAGAAPTEQRPPESRRSSRLVYVREKGAEDCPDEAALRAAVAARLGYDPFLPDAPSTLFATVTRDSTTYRAHVKLVDDSDAVRGARDLEHKGPRCADLTDAMALTISIAIDPRSLVAPVTPTPLDVPVPVPVPVPALVPPTPEPAPPPPPASRSTPAHLFASLSPTASFGAAPATAVGLVGALGLEARPFALALEARGDLPASREVAVGTVSTSFLGATLAPCFMRGIVFGCLLATVGRLAAEARGIAVPRTDAAVHALGGARLGIAEPLTNAVDLRVNADALYAFTPQVLTVDGQDAYTVPRVSVQLGLGLALHFF